MLFTLNRDETIPSTLGHAVEFKANTPTHVPAAMHKLVRQYGAMPAEDEPEEERKVVDTEPQDPGTRLDLIVEQIIDMVELNKRDDFSGAGLPDIKVLSTKLGWKVGAKERDEAWKQFQELRGGK
jgi:hypothetical protein